MTVNKIPLLQRPESISVFGSGDGPVTSDWKPDSKQEADGFFPVMFARVLSQ